MSRILALLTLLLSLPGCAGGAGRQPPTPAAARRPETIEERADLRRYFDEERVTGTLALLDSAYGKIVCADLERCGAAYIPASTFKIPNAIIALETGAASDPESRLPWEGRQYTRADWNQDHTLRSALRVSCVPCFQAIARSIGQPRMNAWLERLDYGNRDTSGGIDRFWLWGGLRISALEQLDFLQRLESGSLPIQKATREFVIDMLALDVGPSHVLRGKTGMALVPNEAMNAGWFVGWLELGARRVFFALVIDGFAADVDPAPLRRLITERILRDQGLLPAGDSARQKANASSR